MTPRFNSHTTAQLLAAEDWRREAMMLVHNARLARAADADLGRPRRRPTVRTRLALALVALGERLNPGVAVLHSQDMRLAPGR